MKRSEASEHWRSYLTKLFLYLCGVTVEYIVDFCISLHNTNIAWALSMLKFTTLITLPFGIWVKICTSDDYFIESTYYLKYIAV